MDSAADGVCCTTEEAALEGRSMEPETSPQNAPTITNRWVSDALRKKN